MRRSSVVLVTVAILSSTLVAQDSPLPNAPDSLKLAVIGDNGTGDRPQYDVADQMVQVRRTFGFDLVLMLGDNLYGGQGPDDYMKKFERPYAPLLESGVVFQASLGNHDSPASRFYKPFNMGGERYYTFARKNVRFFVLDTNFLDRRQLEWIDRALGDSRDDWKICYFHHPLYSNAGRHGSAVDLRVLLEPILVRHGVDVVLSGHDHSYERLKPQKGIHYFVSGAGGKLRKGDISPTETTATFFDQDQSFMLVEIAGTELFFQTISRTGRTVDSGAIRRRAKPTELTSGSGQARPEGVVR
jgi:3',5'-cyclic AMP phosphodiesterase CpdA